MLGLSENIFSIPLPSLFFESNNKKVVDLPVEIIVDDAPEYDREFYIPRKRKNRNLSYKRNKKNSKRGIKK